MKALRFSETSETINQTPFFLGSNICRKLLDPEVEGTKTPRNAGKTWPNDGASHHKRPDSAVKRLRGPQAWPTAVLSAGHLQIYADSLLIIRVVS